MDESKILEIKAVENQAAEILTKAKADFARILNEAGEEGLNNVESAKQKTRAAYQSTLQEFRKKGEKEAASILEGLDTELKKIQKSAELKEKSASEYLLKAVKEKYGNR